jgi:hypothetical protein
VRALSCGHMSAFPLKVQGPDYQPITASARDQLS